MSSDNTTAVEHFDGWLTKNKTLSGADLSALRDMIETLAIKRISKEESTDIVDKLNYPSR